MDKREFETLEMVFEYIKSVDNEKNFGYQILFDKDSHKWVIKIKKWTPFGMEHKWYWVLK